MKWIVRLLAVMSLVGFGCNTMPEPYHPQVIGPLPDAPASAGIALKLTAPVDVISLGNPVTFSVAIRNTSDHALWIPKKPQQAFFWTYPNGRHDCYMIDREATRFFNKSDCLLLQPGSEVVLPSLVETSYFDRPGITEFRAEINVAKNTNPEVEPFWSGRLLSNSYGLHMVPFRNVSGAR